DQEGPIWSRSTSTTLVWPVPSAFIFQMPLGALVVALHAERDLRAVRRPRRVAGVAGEHRLIRSEDAHHPDLAVAVARAAADECDLRAIRRYSRRKVVRGGAAAH